MAYQPENLSALSYANGFTLWHYRTADTIEDVRSTGYFDAATRMLRVGDFICLNAGVGSLPASNILVVETNNGSAVDVTRFADMGAKA